MIASHSTNGATDSQAELRRHREETVLSAAFANAHYFDKWGALSASMFTNARCAFVFETLRQLRRDGHELTLLTVAEAVAKRGDLHEHLGADWGAWLLGLCDGIAVPSADFLSQQMIAEHQRRQLRLQLELLQGELTDPTASVSQIAEKLRTLGSESVTDDVQAVDVAELITDNPSLREPVVDGLFRRGEVANIIAKSKAGKSWLGYSLAFSVALGLNWLGKFRCRPGRALIVDNELHQSDLAFRLRTVGDALGYRVDDYKGRISVITLRGRITDIYGLRKHIERLPGDYSLVLCDALYRFVPEGVSENDNASMTRIYNTLDAYAATTNAAFICIGHASKGDQSNKDRTDVGAGAGAQSRAADCHIIVRPHQEEGAAVLEADLRSFAPIEPLALRWAFPLWSAADDLDPAQLKMPATRQDERQTAKDRDGFDAIVSALREHGPMTTRKLRGLIGAGPERINRLLAQMRADGRIREAEIVINSNSTIEISLAEYLRNE